MSAFVLGAGLLMVMLPLIITRNVIRGQAYRRGIARIVAGMPLGKLLAAHGLEIEDYLHHQRIVDVHDHISHCSGCRDAEDCDRALSQSVNLAPILAYCPNSNALKVALA